MAANELPQLRVVRQVNPGRFLGMNYTGALQSLRDATNAANALDDSGEIVAARIGAFLEIVKIDLRRIPRIARLQRHRPAPVIGVRFQQREGEVVAAVTDLVGIAGKISRKARQQRHDEQIRICLARARPQGEGDRRAVGNIHAATREPLAIDGVVDREARTLQTGPRLCRLVNKPDLVTVLQISTDAL